MLSIGVALLLAVGIFLLAAPRIAAELARMPGQSAMGIVESGARPTDAGLVRAVGAQTASLDLLPQPEPHLSIAYLSIALTGSSDLSQAERSELEEVGRYHLERTLALAPGQPRAWLAMAGLRVRDGDDGGAASALRLSFVTDPHVPNLAPNRWPLALALGPALDRETRQRANIEFLSYFAREPQTALRQALRLDRLAELRALTGDDGSTAAQLDRQIKRLDRRGG